MSVYNSILKATSKGEKLFAVLIDPDKFLIDNTQSFVEKVNSSLATHIFVGGSTVHKNDTAPLVEAIKKYTNLPVVLFPGDVSQITAGADAILFLSLLSGRNAEYLIGKHVKAVPKLKASNLEVIPTGYILIEGGVQTAVSKVTNTKAIQRERAQLVIDTAKAGELLGMKLIYLEAGSGAKIPLPESVINAVKQEIDIPLIVGGGIKNKSQLEIAYKAGADMVVIGTAFEDDESFLEALNK